MGRLIGGVPKPVYRVPPGYERQEVTGKPYYERSGQEGETETLTPEQFRRLRATQVSADNDPTQGFRLVTPRSFKLVPIQRPAPQPTPAPATAPAPAPAPSASPPSPMGAPAPTVSPPSGGPQPSQPAQPSTPARPVTPRPVVSGAAPGTATTPGVSRRRGRRPFVQTAAVGLTTPAQTQKKTLLGG